MKKFILILLAFVFIAPSAFAQDMDVNLQASVTAKATLELTYDIDKEDFVIDNTTDVGVKLNFFEGLSGMAGDDGEVIGFIEVTGIGFNISDADTIRVFEVDDDNTYTLANTGTTPVEVTAIVPKDQNEDNVIDKDDLVKVSTAAASTPTVKAQFRIAGPALYIEVTTRNLKIDEDVFEDFEVFKFFDWPGDGTGNAAASPREPDVDPLKRSSEDYEAEDDEGDSTFTIGSTNGAVDIALILRDDDDAKDTDDPNSPDRFVSFGGTLDLAFLKAAGLGLRGSFFINPNESVLGSTVTTLCFKAKSATVSLLPLPFMMKR